MEFDRDGYLMGSIGDGASQGDSLGRVQDMDDLRGTICRIDVDLLDMARGLPYSIPPDNPYVFDGGSPLPEI